MWHDHFATSNLKVNDLGAMRRQNEVFREHARAPFGLLLDAMMEDPALLVWLDAPSNGRDRPNENLARELFELFTLGVGHYGEADIKEAARALTGRTVVDRRDEMTGGMAVDADARPTGRAPTVDSTRTGRGTTTGEKTILGRTGRWSGSDLVRMLLEHPATSGRLAWRICGLLMGEGAVDRRGIDELAEGLRTHDLDVGWAVGTVLAVASLLRRGQPADPGARPGRVRRRGGAGLRAVGRAAQHARPGRLDGEDGPGPVLPAQCGRLAGRPGLAVDALADRPGQLRRGLRRRPRRRPGRTPGRARPGRAARPGPTIATP